MSVATKSAATGGGTAKRKLTFVDYVAWVSFGFGLIGGAATSGTVVGDLAGWVGTMGWIAQLLALVVVVWLLLSGARDIAHDMVPNRTAVTAALVVPSVARAMNGRLSSTIHSLAGDLAAWGSAHTAGWFGTSAIYALAVVGVLGALVLAKRSVKG